MKTYANEENAGRFAIKVLGHHNFKCKKDNEGRWSWKEIVKRSASVTPIIQPLTKEITQASLIEELKQAQALVLDVTQKLEKAGVTVSQSGKIKKTALQQHGVKQPAESTLCREIWDFCDTQFQKDVNSPTAASMKIHGTAQGWNEHTTLTQFARWKKFSAIQAS
jgi:hypothetical protein